MHKSMQDSCAYITPSTLLAKEAVILVKLYGCFHTKEREKMYCKDWISAHTHFVMSLVFSEYTHTVYCSQCPLEVWEGLSLFLASHNFTSACMSVFLCLCAGHVHVPLHLLAISQAQTIQYLPEESSWL